MSNRFWNVQQIKHLKENLGKKSLDEIARDIGKTFCAVRSKVYELGLSAARRGYRPWTAEEKRIMAEMHRQGASWKEIGKALGRDFGICRTAASRFKMVEVNRVKVWTQHELETLKNMKKAGYSYREISEVLGRSLNAMTAQMKKIRRKNAAGQPV